MNSQLFQVDLNGILKVLSDSLYSSYKVFLRELLQNSVDAITARKMFHDFIPSITVHYFENEGTRNVTIEDNGVGLTFEDVDDFLSKIGSSSKLNKNIDRESFIGQFGIGLLSCFMISDEVIVVSKSAKGDQAIKWVGNINGTYKKELIQEDLEIGTRVYLNIKESVEMNATLVEDLLHLYGDYLEFPVTFENDGSKATTFHKTFPWEKKEFGDAALRLGTEKFKEEFSKFIPLQDRTGKTQGIAYIIPRATHFGNVNSHCVYIKKMFITESSPDILPDWAFFVRAIVNADNVSPTASRESLYKNEVLDQVKLDLGECIKNYLIELSKDNQESLNQILRIHNEALKSLALKDEKFFKFITKWFVFPTSEGYLSLNIIKKKTKTILFISDLDQFRQLLPLAKANDQLLVNAGYIHDTEIFRKLSKIDKANIYQPIDTEYFGNILNEIPIEQYDLIKDRIMELQYHIQEFNCQLEIKSFSPSSMPSIFYMSQENVLERDISSIKEEQTDVWADITDSIFTFSDQFNSKLYLNYDNPLIKKLVSRTASAADSLFVELIYVNSLMMGHYPLKPKELEIMNSSLIKLLEKAL